MIPYGPIATPIEYRPELPENTWIRFVDIRVFKYPKSLGFWTSGRSVVPLEFYFVEGEGTTFRLHPPSELRYYLNRVYAPQGSKPLGFYLDIAEVVEVEGAIGVTDTQSDADVLTLLNRIEAKIDALP